jgi:hypothetical protein
VIGPLHPSATPGTSENKAAPTGSGRECRAVRPNRPACGASASDRTLEVSGCAGRRSPRLKRARDLVAQPRREKAMDESNSMCRGNAERPLTILATMPEVGLTRSEGLRLQVSLNLTPPRAGPAVRPLLLPVARRSATCGLSFSRNRMRFAEMRD